MEAGYVLNNEIANALMFDSKTPIIPLVSRSYERDDDFKRYIAKFNMDAMYSGNSLFGNWWNVNSIASQSEQYWFNGAKDNLPKGLLTKSSYFKMPDQCKLKIRLNFEYTRGATSTLDPFNATISIVPMSIPIISGGTFGQSFNIVVDNTWQIFDETVEIDCEYPVVPGLGDFHMVGFTVWVEKSDEFTVTNVIETRNATLEILDASKILEHSQEIVYRPIVDGFVIDKVSGYTTISNNLPDFTQAEFIKHYMLKTASIFNVDERNKILNIVPFKKLKDNISNANDWTGKLDFTNSPHTEFRLDYAQNNKFKYKDTDKVKKPLGTDKVFKIQDETLEFEKTIIELLYTGTEQVARCNRSVANVKIFEELAIKEVSTPRCLLMRYEDFAFEYRQNVSDSVGAVSIYVNVPIAYFIDRSQSYSNGFDYSLFDEFYTFIVGIIGSSKKIECDIRLTLSDISTLDPLIPVYLREFDAHFYVNKIKYEYTSRKSSVVELIKLL